jgi:transcriptional/translational regulatory protein YebC/TACO1
MFKKKGIIAVEKGAVDEDKLFELAIDAGAEDMNSDDPEGFQILTAPENYQTVRDALEKAGIPIADGEVSLSPENTVRVSGHAAEQVLKLVEEMEDHEDVQGVSANFDIDAEELAQITAA